VDAYGKLPLSFEANQGQDDPSVQFQSRGSGYGLLLTRDSAILASCCDRQKDQLLFMRVVGANPNVRVEGLNQLSTKSNYFVGDDPKRWETNIPNYGGVKYSDIYRGVDLVYHGNQGQLEYDFVVRPGADPSQITVALESPTAKSSPRIDSNGDLITGANGTMRFRKPVIYQSTNFNGAVSKDDRSRVADRHLVEGRYVLKGDRIGFEIGDYDRSMPLVIDPTLVYATYLGGNVWAHGYAIAVDSSGNTYFTGRTTSTQGLAKTGAYNTKNASFSGLADAFVGKLNAAGSAMTYITYLGGSYDDESDGIAVDASGDAYVTGWTSSANFPTTSGAFRTAIGGGYDDGFVTKLNPTGSALIYSTFLGGNGHDEGHAIAVDSLGDSYVTGTSYSTNFPTTAGALQTTLGGLDDAFITKLNPLGSALVYSTYLGGAGHDDSRGIAVDASGNAYVAGFSDSTNFPATVGALQKNSGGGYDAFVSKLNPTGSALVYSTYLGGSNDDFIYGIAIDGSGNAYVTGDTFSANFPATQSASQTTLEASGTGHDDAFVSKLNAAGSVLLYSSYLGGSGNDVGYGIVVDKSGNAYITGATNSSDFPTSGTALQPTPGGYDDGFFSEFNPTGSTLTYSTYLAGKGVDQGKGIAADALGNIYIVGWTESKNFPVTTGAYQTILTGADDAFVAKFSTP
jgi:hypothetical protein